MRLTDTDKESVERLLAVGLLPMVTKGVANSHIASLCCMRQEPLCELIENAAETYSMEGDTKNIVQFAVLMYLCGVADVLMACKNLGYDFPIYEEDLEKGREIQDKFVSVMEGDDE